MNKYYKTYGNGGIAEICLDDISHALDKPELIPKTLAMDKRSHAVLDYIKKSHKVYMTIRSDKDPTQVTIKAKNGSEIICKYECIEGTAGEEHYDNITSMHIKIKKGDAEALAKILIDIAINAVKKQ